MLPGRELIGDGGTDAAIWYSARKQEAKQKIGHEKHEKHKKKTRPKAMKGIKIAFSNHYSLISDLASFCAFRVFRGQCL